MIQQQPIGIFDSGIGGLTVANAIAECLPNEDIIYVGDTAHTPWGDKSEQSIIHYASQITDFLLNCQCKAIVIACNTAASVAKQAILPKVTIPSILIDVITPVIEYLSNHLDHCTIGLIGTKRTIASNVYQTEIQKLNKQLKLRAIATPILVPLIEEGFAHHPATLTLFKEYFKNGHFDDINHLILGCTHYPLIKKDIQRYFQSPIHIIDSAELVAQQLKQQLQAHDLLNPDTSQVRSPSKHFYVTDPSDCFVQIAKRLFKTSIQLEILPLWV